MYSPLFKKLLIVKLDSFYKLYIYIYMLFLFNVLFLYLTLKYKSVPVVTKVNTNHENKAQDS